MALRLNQIEFPIGARTTSLAANTRLDYSAVTLHIPETSSRTFRSVVIEITVRDDSDTAGNMPGILIGVQLGAAGGSDATVLSSQLNSGEHQSNNYTRDVTSYFNSNFGAGASQTCVVSFRAAGLATINICAKLYVLYEYDDASLTTAVKTVRIPLDSLTGQLSTTLTEIGTNQVPALDTELPESSKTYRNIWFEIETNEYSTGTNAFQLGLGLDSESEVNDGSHRQALNSSVYYRFIWDRSADFPSTASAHAFKARAVNSSAVGDHLRVLLCVTYTYDASTSSTIYNSVILGGAFPLMGAESTSGDKDRARVTINVQEPGTITLRQSGIAYSFSHRFTGTTLPPSSVNVAVGGQTARTYTFASLVSGEVACGQFSLMQRIDSGGAQGSAFTPARGVNSIDIDVHRTATDAGRHTAPRVLVYLNYTSSKASAGVGAHNKTITVWPFLTGASAVIRESSAMTVPIPESLYAVSNVFASLSLVSQGSNNFHATLLAEVLSGEAPGDGWRPLLNMTAMGDLELTWNVLTEDSTREWARQAFEPDARRLVLTGSRKYRFVISLIQSTGQLVLGTALSVTYHSIVQTLTGTVSGYTGDGSGIGVNIHEATGEKRLIAQATTSAGGGYSASVYDDTVSKFASARQDATHVGRSDEATS